MSKINPKGQCLNCGRPIHYKDKFCMGCFRKNDGWVDAKPNECGNCHARLGSEDKYCTICGTKAGEGKFEPYQNIIQCIYGPMPVVRNHICRDCGYQWKNCMMIDKEKYCPKCGNKVEVSEDGDNGDDIIL